VRFSRSTQSRALRGRRGFTLIESAIVTVIIGVGAVAVLELLATGTASNMSGAEVTTGVSLAKQIRELTLQSTFNDTITLDGEGYDPPFDAGNNPITKLAGWKQTIKVQPVSPDKLTQDLASTEPDAARVTVVVTHNGRRVCEMSWLRFR
jgi:prepilin-type N-terminal cleavage/methylation domain-containing protein